MSKDIYLVMVMEPGAETILPFPLLYIGTALKQSDYRVHLRHIRPAEIETTADEICRAGPLWVGFSVLTGMPTLHSATMSQRIKAAGSVPVVWGGVHPSLLPQQCISEEYIDYVVIGEGEMTAVELSQALEGGRSFPDVQGILYKDRQGGIMTTPRRSTFIRLEDYPLDFSLIDVSRYITVEHVLIEGKKTRVRSLGYCASRGCPHGCGFCYNVEFNSRRWRSPSSDFVIKDIQRLKREYGITKVHFWDDNFFANPKRALDILGAIDMPVGADVRIDYVNETTARELRKNKVVFLLIGIESGSNRILELIHKGFTVDTIRSGARILNEYGIPVLYSAIVGFPTETKEELHATIDLLCDLKKIHSQSSFTIGMYLPYPGTDLYRKAVQEGFRPPQTTQGWHVIDRWNNKVPLPWSNQDVCRNIRHLFFFLTSAPRWMRSWASLRLKHKWLKFGMDIKIYLIVRSLFLSLKRPGRRTTAGPTARKIIRHTFIVRYSLRGLSALKHRLFGVPDIGMYARMSYFLRTLRYYGIDTKLRENPGARILDAGCGDGSYSLYLGQAMPHARIDAWDRSPTAIGENNHLAKRLSLTNVHFIQRDLLLMPDTTTYDFVVCIAVLIYGNDDDNSVILRNLYRSLNPGGRVYLFQTRKGWESALVIPPRFYATMYADYLRQNCGKMYTSEEFERLLTEAGFNIRDERVVSGFWGELAWELDKIFKEYKLERWKVFILPLLKGMCLVDMHLHNKKGTGMVFVVQKPG